MEGEIKATPRNGAFGTIADAIRSVDHFAGKPFGYDNQPGRIISNLLGLPAIANTADEMSYGGSRGTGSGTSNFVVFPGNEDILTILERNGTPPGYADGGSVRAMVNAAVGSSNLAKQVGNSADAVRSIAAGTGSMGDLNSLRQMAASMGYTSPGLSQAMGLAGAAKAGYNAMNDPSGKNLAGFASSVNPLAAKALSIYNAVTDPEPAGFVDALASFNPLTSAWNTLARAADFATLGQVVRNVNKISDPNAPAELRDMLSNNPNSASLTRNANDLSALTGRDSLDTMMDMTGAFGTIPGVPSYYSGASGSSTGTTSAPNGGGSFPSYSGGDGVNGHSDAGGYGGYGGGF